ncbi:MAG: hypothetical protein ABI168_06255 [Ginsengibacter sp.]
MNDRDGFEGCAGFRKLKEDMATSTIAESQELVSVNIRYREKNVQCYTTNNPHPSIVSQQGYDPSQHRVGPAKEGLSAMKVHRECNIAMGGEIISASPLVVVKTNTVVTNENCGPRTLSVWPS